MLCKQCQMKVLRHCVSECGGMIPLNALECDNPEQSECNWKDFAYQIVDIFTEKNRDSLEKIDKK